jgi:hypothetical protein
MNIRIPRNRGIFQPAESLRFSRKILYHEVISRYHLRCIGFSQIKFLPLRHAGILGVSRDETRLTFVEIGLSIWQHTAGKICWTKRSLFPVNSVPCFGNELAFYGTFHVSKHMTDETFLHKGGSYFGLFAHYCCERTRGLGRLICQFFSQTVVLGLVQSLVQTVMYAQRGGFYNKTGEKESLEVRSSGFEIACIGSH